MKIAIFGTGYVGLISGLGFAEMGHQVLCYDRNPVKINQLILSQMPLYEASADKLLQKHAGRNIHFTNQLENALHFSNVIFLCINLIQKKTSHTELEPLFSIIKNISNLMKSDKILVLKSTLPVGTHHWLEGEIKKLRLQFRLQLITNPEFLSEGEAVKNFLKPDRIILGGTDFLALSKIKKIYKPWLKKNIPLLEMDANSAEMTKHAANCMLATRVSFMNEISRLCEKTNSNIQSVQAGISLDPRIGSLFLNVGPGYGGSCLPKDIAALIRLGHIKDERMNLLSAVQLSNKQQTNRIILKIISVIKTHHVRQMTVWGASYKAGTDDLRGSLAIEIIQQLAIHKVKIKLFDPAATTNLKKKKLPNNLVICDKQSESLRASELLVVLNEWPQFKKYPLSQIKLSLKQPIIFDCKNLFSLKQIKKNDLIYYSLGRPE